MTMHNVHPLNTGLVAYENRGAAHTVETWELTDGVQLWVRCH